VRKRDLESYARKHFGLDLGGFIRQKVKNEALYDYEIASILGVSRGRIGTVRRELGITKKEGFPARFERKYGKGSVARFKSLIENPTTSLADVGNRFGFSREYARQVYREIFGYPYSVAYRRKKEERQRQKAAHAVEAQPVPLLKIKKVADRRRVSAQPSIEDIIRPRFRGVRGINCRFGINEESPVSQDIQQVIWRKISDNRPPIHPSESRTATENGALKHVNAHGR
jgi:hypothetical protein